MCPPVWFDNPKSVILNEGRGTFKGAYLLSIVDEDDRRHEFFILGDRRVGDVFEDEREFWKAWRGLRDEDGLYQPDWSRKAIERAVEEFEERRKDAEV